MPDRFRTEIVYFADPLPGERGSYTIDTPKCREILDDGVFRLVSPLDSEGLAEIEISEDQERFLEWVTEYKVAAVKIL
ncbi:hypothetical protein Pan189_27400 [Stratiformator vulcanicus]|uniref:Uncharacterized protein n=2 Tax=Stratiformator vulcanicus TaxID=2527980 RepID=A0A517R390_9PLAN|nr:hypothetical protein Pan189_27400 [Stratiformator vulcanicus]